MAEKYSEKAVKAKIENSASDEISGEDGDLIPYLIAKTSMSKPEVLTVISEFIFAGVDTVCKIINLFLLVLLRYVTLFIPDVPGKGHRQTVA